MRFIHLAPVAALFLGLAGGALAADGTLKLEQGLSPISFNGDVGGGEFGVYEFSNPSVLAPIAPPVKVNDTINYIPGFDFQTFCLDPHTHIEFNELLSYTISTTVVYLDGQGQEASRNLNPATAYLYTKFWNATAFSPTPYVYSPLGVGNRSLSAGYMQFAIWFTEGVWDNPDPNTYPDPIDSLPAVSKQWVLEAFDAVGSGGSWAVKYGTTFPGNLGNVRALIMRETDEHLGELQQPVLVMIRPPAADCVGYTPGFWHNKNGLKLIKSSGGGAAYSWIGVLNDLHLRTGAGGNADFSQNAAGAADLSDWLVSGNNAVNMAQKLSQQLAAMQLNVLRGSVDPLCYVYTGTNGSCLPGSPVTITVGELMALAEESLEDHGYTPTGDPERAYQECLKNILDAANNNGNWVD